MSLHARMLHNALEHRNAWKPESIRWRRWDIECRYFAARLIAGSYE